MVTRTLTSHDVEHLVEWGALVDALELAHRSLARGVAVQPAPDALAASDDHADDAPAVVPMFSLDASLGLFSVKVLADAPRNRAAGLPAQRSTVCLFSAETGECIGVVDGRALTRIRTAAVTAMASRALARAESTELALLGSGPLAIEHARAVARLFPLQRIRLWSRSRERAACGAAELQALGLPAVAEPSLELAVAGADIICTLTPSLEPILPESFVAPGTHVNAIGSPPRPLYSEVAPATFAQAAVVAVDSRAVALADSGNIRRALAAGAIEQSRLVEIGEILAGTASGRRSPEEITVYNSVGIGLQDLAAADHVLRRAARADAGTMVTIRD